MTFKEKWAKAVAQSKEMLRLKNRHSRRLEVFKLLDSLPEAELAEILKFPMNFSAYRLNESIGLPVHEYFELFPKSVKPIMAVEKFNRLFKVLKPDKPPED